MSGERFRTAFFTAALEQLSALEGSNAEALDQASEEISSRLSEGGRLFVFGCGHSGLAGQDIYYRAGGLKAAVFLFDSRVTLDHEPVAATSDHEKKPGWANKLVEAKGLGARDSLIVVSTSGVNAAPVDAAKAGRDSGAFVVSISSFAYDEALDSRHPSRQRLREVAHLNLNNLSPYGDTLVKIGPDPQRRAGSASTAASALLLQALTTQIAGVAAIEAVDLPLYVSGNIPGGQEKNGRD
ncbi:MAG: sugar isomerase domain-containing protein [Planctomycetota bacterium]